MIAKRHPLIGEHSPWGTIDSVEELADGITFVGTPGHGGIRLGPERIDEMPEPYRRFQSRHAKPPFYEEDCDWAVPVLAFAEEVPIDHVRNAIGIVRAMPAYFGQAIYEAAGIMLWLVGQS